MQRRAAAVYFVLFVVLAGGAYTFIEVGATEPEVQLDGPTYTKGDTFTVDGRTYMVTTVEATVEEGEHGEPATFTREGELTWYNESADSNETIGIAEGDNVTLNGQEYFVHFPNNSTVQVLPTDEYYSEYNSDLAAMDEYDRRINGLWGIVLLSLLAAIILIAAAYLPNKG